MRSILFIAFTVRSAPPTWLLASSTPASFTVKVPAVFSVVVTSADSTESSSN